MMEGSIGVVDEAMAGLESTNSGTNGRSSPLVASRHRAYLNPSDSEALRRIIKGTVASMTAEKLSARYDVGLEHDRLYEKAIAEFRFLVVDPRTRLTSLLTFIDEQLPRGRPDYVKVLFLEAVARLLGKEWTQDTCDFIDVTIGTARLQELVQSLALAYRDGNGDMSAPHALILTPKGEQHTLMPHMIGLLFDTLGWSRRVLEPSEYESRSFHQSLDRADVVCIGWSNIRLADEFETLVHAIRHQRPDRRLPLIVGGAGALNSIDLLVGLGIDCICDSVYSAVKICQNYCELQRIGQHSREAVGTALVTPSGIDWLTQ
jgi:hypothetical protein